MSSPLKVTVQSTDRKLLLTLVKAERRNIEITASAPVTTGAQKRAVQYYEEHLLKVQKKLDPNSNYHGKY